jgi:hypothetical protein
MYKKTIAALSTLLLAACAVSQHVEPALELHGGIDAALDYRLSVEFATTSPDRACQFADYITGMWVAQRNAVAYEPDVQGDHHQVRVPLAYPEGSGVCGWKPLVVSACVGARGTAASDFRCQALYVVKGPDDGIPADAALHCRRDTWVCTVSTAAGQSPQPVAELGRRVRLDIQVEPAAR